MLYLISDRNLSLSERDVIAFTNVIENPIELVDTTSSNFIRFFDLLNHVIQNKFVIDCYHRIISKEKRGVTCLEIQHCLHFIADQLKNQLYIGILPSNYCALTCLNCQIILNGSTNCLFHRVEEMVR